ncbi:MAG: hypothetical protein KDC98_24745 [Planctomycetes bacterium]|nr:hypothetical protein [Planctomycetota bacterium]
MIRVGPLSTACLTTALLVLAGMIALSPEPKALRADPSDPVIDSDGDFLPDAVEWAVLTSAQTADTDGDQRSDFVEVVEHGTPRHPGSTTADDHAMRVVLTGPSTPGSSEPTWLHLFFRFFGDPGLTTSFSASFETETLPGLQLPLNVLGFPGVVMRQRSTANEGYWLQISIPLASEQFLRQLLPLSIRADAVIGGAHLSSAVRLEERLGTVTTLVPFGDGRYVMQSIGSLPYMLASNRVCLLTLEQAGASGTAFKIVDADCESCNELECGASCRESVGWVIDVPGGLGDL